MKQPFDRLTGTGRDRRLRPLVADLLRQYGLEVRSCVLAARSFNTVFRITGSDGRRYALRVSPAVRIHADGTEEAEACVAAELARAGLHAPAVIRTRDGSAVSVAARDDVPGRRTGVLFEWVPGRPLTGRTTPARMAAAGRIGATLHELAVERGPAEPPDVLHADRVLYFRLPDRLASTPYGGLFPLARDRAQAVLDRLWREPRRRPMLLHGDLYPANLLLVREQLWVIDAQDLIWGLDVQDLSITLTALRRLPDSEALERAFMAGYRQVRPWPSLSTTELDALVAARRLNQLNLTLNLVRDDLTERLARHARDARQWLDGGTGVGD